MLHEWLASLEPYRKGLLPRLVQLGHFDSARNQKSRREKYLADAALLRHALATEPGHRRYQFYLAQSLRDAGAFDRAIEAYRRRAAMGGSREEISCSHFEVGRMLEASKAPRDQVMAAFLAAATAGAERAEPLVQLARVHRGGRSVCRYARKAARLEPWMQELALETATRRRTESRLVDHRKAPSGQQRSRVRSYRGRGGFPD